MPHAGGNTVIEKENLKFQEKNVGRLETMSSNDAFCMGSTQTKGSHS